MSCCQPVRHASACGRPGVRLAIRVLPRDHRRAAAVTHALIQFLEPRHGEPKPIGRQGDTERRGSPPISQSQVNVLRALAQRGNEPDVGSRCAWNAADVRRTLRVPVVQAGRVTATEDRYEHVYAARRDQAAASLRLSAWAWGFMLVGLALQRVGLGGRLGSVPFWAVAALLVTGLLAHLAFVVLTVLAVRAAWRGSDSGSSVSTWAGVVAGIDVVAALVLVLATTAAIWLAWTVAQCSTDANCSLFTF